MTKEELIKLSRENLRKSKQGSLCECYDEAFIKGYELSKKRIAELEKENAELKEKLGNYQKGMFDEIEKRDINFTKAIEIIEGLMRFCRCFAQHHTEDIRYKEAEQFLNSEVEK